VKAVTIARRFALLTLLAAGCDGGGGEHADGGTPPPSGSDATIQFVLRSGADLGPLPAQAGGLTVESVAFWMDRLSLSGDRSGGYQGQNELRSQLLDLTGGPVTFDLPNIAPALYSRVRADFSGADEHDQVPVLEGMELSVRVSGKTAAGVPFALLGRDDFGIDLRMVDGAELGAHTRLSCVIRLDMAGWFDGVNLTPPGGSSDHGGDGSLGPFIDNLVRSASMSLSAVDR
jgi:hypothetical protein